MLTLAEAAERLRVSRRTVEREIADGKLAIVRVRSRRLIEPQELDRYIAAQRCQSESTAIAGKSESASAVAVAMRKRYRPAPLSPTRERSKLHAAARRLTLRLVESPADPSPTPSMSGSRPPSG